MRRAAGAVLGAAGVVLMSLSVGTQVRAAAADIPYSVPTGPVAANPGFNDLDCNNPNTAGSAFMELQFYPPGYGPWLDSTSPDATRWTVALTIDSLEVVLCNPPGFTGCLTTNPHCTEPINFSFLTLTGVPP